MCALGAPESRLATVKFVEDVIDVHTHLHPPRLFAAIRRWFAERSDWVLEHPTEPKAVAAILRGHGIERFAFCSYAHKPGIASQLNAWLLETARELGPGAIPLATVHPADGDPGGDARAALAGGCAGLKVHEDVQRVRLDDDQLAPALAAVAAADGFVLVHVGPIPWSPATGGPERVARVLERHPRLRVVVAHFGVPEHERYVALAEREPRLFLDTTMIFPPHSPMHVPVDASLVERIASQVVLGTDFPNIPYPYGDEAHALRRLGLRDSTLRAIFTENARRLAPAFA